MKTNAVARDSEGAAKVLPFSGNGRTVLNVPGGNPLPLASPLSSRALPIQFYRFVAGVSTRLADSSTGLLARPSRITKATQPSVG